MFKQIALLALASAGCSGEVFLQPGDSVFVDESFSAADAEAVLTGIAGWNEAFPALGLRPAIGEGASFEWTIRNARISDGRRGTCKSHQPLIQVDVMRIYGDGRGPAGVTSTTLHEIGHAVGLHRDGNHANAGFMMSDSASITCVDAATLADVCATRHELCDGRERVTCDGV